VSKQTIYSPTPGFNGRVAGVQFAEGRGETDNPGALAFFKRRGYGVGSAPDRRGPATVPDGEKPGADSSHVDAATNPNLTATTTAPVAPAGGEFDPSSRSVEEVIAHLEQADDAERQRVLDAERAGKARKGILGDGS
jgi:hypothetical protein